MKVIHTYVDKGGVVWKELLYTQYLSAVLAKKHYGNISFYGDVEECKQISDLGLPYDEVNNKIVKREDTKTWSIPKLKVYESLDEPFLHIDTDTLLFNKIVFETYEQDYLFSHIDMHTPSDLSKDKLVSQLYKYYSNPPYENVKKSDGGHNYFYFNKTYSKLFFDLILSEENKENIVVHCWRGGMRSSFFAYLLEFFGLKVTIIKGGYKYYRQQVIKSFEANYNFSILGGMTGSGKTHILHELDKKFIAIIDLEGLANHRGSSFGALGRGMQPSQEQFENNLSLQLIKSKK
mgnify:CR=1 FL=1